MNELLRFDQALRSKMPIYGLDLPVETLAQLGEFFSLLTRWNDRLHLVAPCSPEQFATRHVLESLMLLEHLPREAKIADVGSGAGLPIIPCLIARADLNVTMIESSQKKAIFLREALNVIGRTASIVARRFEEIETPNVEFITCRALDKFMEKVSTLIDWAPKGSTLLLYGGDSLRAQLPEAKEFLMPQSEKRFLFVVSTDYAD
jgi:16S rRNA (guanine527-N7)-methyltransferase